jgi:hypothetical protein
MPDPSTSTTSTSPSEPLSTAETELEPAIIEGGLTSEPEAIDVLFSREDPLSWSEADMERIVSKNRELRKDFDLDPKKAQRVVKEKIDVSDVKSGDDLLAKLGLGDL